MCVPWRGCWCAWLSGYLCGLHCAIPSAPQLSALAFIFFINIKTAKKEAQQKRAPTEVKSRTRMALPLPLFHPFCGVSLSNGMRMYLYLCLLELHWHLLDAPQLHIEHRTSQTTATRCSSKVLVVVSANATYKLRV